MKQPYCTEVKDWHIEYVAENMRKADKDEIWAHSLSRPLDALKFAVGVSTACWTIMNPDDIPVALFGVGAVSMMGGIGSPWLLSTDELINLSRQFLKGNKEYVDKMLDQYELLENHIDSRNKVSIRWLKWLGFDILDAEPHGPFQVPFHVFRMERDTTCVYH